jgi:hypothetical protein
MKLPPLNQRASPRVPLTTPGSGRATPRGMAERAAREADECLVGRFSTRLPRAAPRKA